MKFTIIEMSRIIDGGIVTTLHWSAKKVSGEHQANTYGTFNLQEKSPSDDSFIPYENITEELAIEWLKDALGESAINAIETNLDFFISEQIKPKYASGLPWKV